MRCIGLILLDHSSCPWSVTLPLRPPLPHLLHQPRLRLRPLLPLKLQSAALQSQGQSVWQQMSIQRTLPLSDDDACGPRCQCCSQTHRRVKSSRANSDDHLTITPGLRAGRFKHPCIAFDGCRRLHQVLRWCNSRHVRTLGAQPGS